MLFKKELITIYDDYYNDYLINSKNCYIFKDNKELELRISKIIDNRVANLTDNAYLLVKDNNFYDIVKKYSFYIR
jgi:hypothetical protein